MNRMGLGLGLGSSKSLKKAWYSTQIFQKTLQQSLLAMVNSSVSWWAFCWRNVQAEISTDGRREEGKNDGDEKKKVLELTAGSALSLMRNRLRLKLSLRTLDQLKALIFV